MSDIIDHPPHYEACRVSIEPIDVCEAYDFCTGNAIKYLCRAGKKAGSSEVTDLKKARWYLERALASKTLRIADRLPLAGTPEGMRVRGAILLLCSQVPLLATLINFGFQPVIEQISARIDDIEGNAS